MSETIMSRRAKALENPDPDLSKRVKEREPLCSFQSIYKSITDFSLCAFIYQVIFSWEIVIGEKCRGGRISTDYSGVAENEKA